MYLAEHKLIRHAHELEKLFHEEENDRVLLMETMPRYVRMGYILWLGELSSGH
jgi:hypothetical protein